MSLNASTNVDRRVAAQSEQAPIVAITRFQAVSSDFQSKPTKVFDFLSTMSRYLVCRLGINSDILSAGSQVIVYSKYAHTLPLR